MVTYIAKGNIFKLERVNAYAHGCNCVGAMGRGIAVQFRERYPEMYREYRRRCEAREFIPGSVYLYEKGGEAVFNLGTEKHWKLGAELIFIERALRVMMDLAHQHDIRRIALPRIGAGLGRLDWEAVKEIINHIAAEDTEVELFVVEEYEP